MIQIILFFLILLFPVSSEAAYKIYLKNGSVISGVDYYTKKGGEVTVYFGDGSMDISEKDILKIEGTESSAETIQSKELPETEEKPKETSAPNSIPADDKNKKANALISEVESINSEIKALQEQESKIVETINQKQGGRVRYPASQKRLLDNEITQLNQELSDIQHKKEELSKRGASLVDELNALEQKGNEATP
jgi:DNA repair exonuclease SbcCD ATPase subunit